MTNFCRRCQKENAIESRFCRFCGEPMYPPPPTGPTSSPTDETLISPRPYMWKTEELDTAAAKRTPVRSTVEHVAMPQNVGQPYYGAQPLMHRQNFVPGNYRCPNCGTTYLPVIERRISTAGWITFALLLIFTFFFFWIGLLIKEDVSVCPVCRYRLTR